MPTTAAPAEPRSAIYRTAKHRVGGDLKKYLTEARGRGDSFNTIAAALTKLGILVTYETVRSWCARLEIV